MLAGLNRFEAHIPDTIYLGNPTVQQFVAVANGMLEERAKNIERYTRSFDPQLEYETRILKLYIDEFKGEYLPDVTRGVLECLYLHKREIFSKKGTIEGLKRLFACLCSSTDISVEYTASKPLLHSFDISGGVLPEGQDLANELDGTKVPPIYVPTLLDGSWSDYYTTIVIEVSGSNRTDIEFKNFLLSIVPLYVTMVDKNSSSITLNFI